LLDLWQRVVAAYQAKTSIRRAPLLIDLWLTPRFASG
jgi:hypothetical protein